MTIDNIDEFLKVREPSKYNQEIDAVISTFCLKGPDVGESVTHDRVLNRVVESENGGVGMVFSKYRVTIERLPLMDEEQISEINAR